MHNLDVGKEGFFMSYGGWGNSGCYSGGNNGELFVLIVVLFILLVIVGAVIIK